MLGLSCSVTLENREPFLGKIVFSGAATKKKGKKGAPEQLSGGFEGKPKGTPYHLWGSPDSVAQGSWKSAVNLLRP